MTRLTQHSVLSRFACLAERCEDTCCKHWSMQVDEATLDSYRAKAPALLDAVEPDHDGSPVMRKDASTGCCVKLEGGLCGIQRQFGASMLGDACFFYPRITRALGEHVVATASLSCPEIVRLALEEDLAVFSPGEAQRLPQSLKDYLPQAMPADDALYVHRCFLQAAQDGQACAEQLFARIAGVAQSLEMIDKKDWAGATPTYLRLADARLVAPQPDPADAFNLLHALMGLVVASKKPIAPRLAETLAEMERALKVRLDWPSVQIHLSQDSAPALQDVRRIWESHAPHFDGVLKKYMQMQIAMSLFPFAGLGETMAERATLIGVRLATIKLAFMCACGIYESVPPQDIVVRIVQSISRFLDHLGDARFSLLIYGETGWTRPDRMRGLLSA